MNPLQGMANDELADLYCTLCSEYVDLSRLAPFPDPLYVSALEYDIHRVHGEIATRGLFEYEAPGLLAS
ncbi:hypothetical protein ACIGKR_12110 [Rhodococcus qingshengii]|uniref:hypothetical protein n=1 Tax=Rhodococcus qingshengii TaxID=334542 RepID=UPI0037C9491B